MTADQLADVGHIFKVNDFSWVTAEDPKNHGYLKSQSVECLLLYAILAELRAIRVKLEEPEAL